jgi:hypothetical protein
MTTTVPSYDIEIIKGEDASVLSLQWLNPDKSIIDLTGMQVVFTIKNPFGETSLVKTILNGVTLTNNIINIWVYKTDSVNLKVGSYKYTVFITDTANITTKLIYGAVSVI